MHRVRKPYRSPTIFYHPVYMYTIPYREFTYAFCNLYHDDKYHTGVSFNFVHYVLCGQRCDDDSIIKIIQILRELFFYFGAYYTIVTW